MPPDSNSSHGLWDIACKLVQYNILLGTIHTNVHAITLKYTLVEMNELCNVNSLQDKM